MSHPKMGYTYVGIDSHKDTHTAVLLDCFFQKLGELTFANLPSKFGDFLKQAEKLKIDNTELLFGLEDISAYGRQLTVYLIKHNQPVKHVNALLVARERQNQNITYKTDSKDAECAARVLLSKLDTLPDAKPEDKYWILRTLVIRRDSIIKHNTALKNQLHDLLSIHYPRYHDYFKTIDSKTSFAFFMHFPSPSTLKNTNLKELTKFLHQHSKGQFREEKAEEIWNSLEDTGVEYQEIRDSTVQSTIRQLQFNQQEIEQIEKSLATFLTQFECTLTSMTGIDIVTAAQMLSCIGDIKKFSSPAKLARYSGVAPVSYSSGKKDMQYANKRGNRELNSLFYCLAVRLISAAAPRNKAINPFFYEYYHRKLSEGKTKKQALKCVQRRLVNIIWTMLTNNEDYVNPPMIEIPNKKVI